MKFVRFFVVLLMSSCAQNFVIADTPPEITSPNATTFVVGRFSVFIVTTAGFPNATDITLLTDGNGISEGLHFRNIPDGSNAAGLVGFPTTAGVYALVIQAYSRTDGLFAFQFFTLTVNPATTITKLNTACMRTFVEGQPFTMTAFQSDPNASGEITFTQRPDNMVLCGNVPLVSGSCTTSSLITTGSDVQDSYDLVASYGGDSNNFPSDSSPLGITVLSAEDVLFRNDFEMIVEGCPIE